MGRQVITITNAHLKIGDTATLTTSPDFACQVSSAAINAVPKLTTVPATFCAGESQSPGLTGWELVLTWLQDWDLVPASPTAVGSLSKYAFDNDAVMKFFSLSVSNAAAPLATGQCYVVAGSYGGEAGVPLTATATWPLLAKPGITAGVQAVPAMMEFNAEGQYVEQQETVPTEESVPA